MYPAYGNNNGNNTTVNTTVTFSRYPLSLSSGTTTKPPSLSSLQHSSSSGPATPSPFTSNAGENSIPSLITTTTTTTTTNTNSSTGQHYDRQYSYAQRSRQASSPHHHARTAALVARNTLTSNPITLAHPSTASTNDLKHRPSNSKSAAAAATAGAGTNTTESAWSILDMGGVGLNHLTPVLTTDYLFLTVLYINHNNLTTLPASLCKLTQLTILDASSNRLSTLPAELGLLVQLKELLLFDNQLTTLPTELGTLYQLETLGLEGNPLSSDMLRVLLEEGSAAVIVNLRENAEVGMPPPQREMVRVLTDDEEERGGGDEKDKKEDSIEKLSVLCYNVLCQKLATNQAYGYTPSWALGWDYRKELVMTEILRWNSDVICLQEIEMSQFEDFFRDRFQEAGGYESIFFPKSRAKTMTDDERRSVDGCAIFYKASRYKLLAHHLLEYSQTVLQRSDLKESEDTFNRVMVKDNVAIMILLQDIKTGSRVLVANSHIHWDPQYADVKLVQVGILLEEIERFTEKHRGHDKDEDAASTSKKTSIPTVICGDFNSQPDSGVYELLAKGSIKKNHPDFDNHVYGNYTSKGIKHNLTPLKSAYASIGELPFTNYTPRFKGVLDYIWHTADTLETVSVLGPIDQDYLDKVVGFPNPHFPSDHIAIAAQLRFKKNNKKHPTIRNTIFSQKHHHTYTNNKK
ncbi:Endonuclease/exonuclease/phosphatase [Phascolomyces articulosus]|uniref:CCR4-Not complex 3'-5'-exoribonuclease subunit Ccr4 n=1 Tax=Phascolomyces articulosus TaxID=60185 RepID=A0AAD5P9E7_9FUNG|nr:Endonuclease/exonuclease/phosphatase [Phascolomyces articulosus]